MGFKTRFRTEPREQGPICNYFWNGGRTCSRIREIGGLDREERVLPFLLPGDNRRWRRNGRRRSGGGSGGRQGARGEGVEVQGSASPPFIGGARAGEG